MIINGGNNDKTVVSGQAPMYSFQGVNVAASVQTYGNNARVSAHAGQNRLKLSQISIIDYPGTCEHTELAFVIMISIKLLCLADKSYRKNFTFSNRKQP